MADKQLEGIGLAFVSGALKDTEVRLVGVVGRERLSQLFAFDLLLAAPAGLLEPDQLDEMLKEPCAITLGPRKGDTVHGILQSMEMLDAPRNRGGRYLARMVPSVWLLTLARTNRLFQETTVPKMVEEILTLYGLTSGSDFDILITGKPRSLEYVVQYEESDWDFIQRWLENEGYFYWFEHGGEGEKLIIADQNTDSTPIEDPAHLSYREKNNLSAGGTASVWDFRVRQSRIPARLAIVDYNYRSPHVPMVATADVDTERGFGSVFFYGEHFKDTGQGKAIASVRAERFNAERRVFSGDSDCGRFRVGHSFELENHHEASFDGKYLITSMDHRAGLPMGPTGEPQGDAPQRYFGHFEAIPFDVQFRPERVTPWPSIHGVLHGHVDADGSGDTAQIDDQGRYKVRLPFDLSGRKGMKASRWVRMAQPYSGQGYGSHFPLHKGTEVLLSHVDGDPDRPIIVGSVPNPHTASPSTSSNATQSVIQTASGIRIEMEDLQS